MAKVTIVRLQEKMLYLELRDRPLRDVETFCGHVFAEEDIEILDNWQVENGFIHIRVSGNPQRIGFVRPHHLSISYRSQLWQVINDDDWYTKLWCFQSDDISVCVKDASYMNSTDVDLAEVGFAPLEPTMHESLFSRGYTYIALYIGRPQRVITQSGKVMIAQTWEECHLTIGYAARMTLAQRCNLRRKMEEVLTAWKNMAPLERYAHPSVFYRRKFDVLRRDRQEYRQHPYGWERTGIVNRDDIDFMIENDCIDDLYYDSSRHGSKQKHIRRLFDRDRGRKEDARKRAEKLTCHNGWFVIQHQMNPNGRHKLASASDELKDLMEHLSDRAYYDSSCHWEVEGNKVVPPFCGEAMYWHCTRQGDWVALKDFVSEQSSHRYLFEVCFELNRKIEHTK